MNSVSLFSQSAEDQLDDSLEISNISFPMESLFFLRGMYFASHEKQSNLTEVSKTNDIFSGTLQKEQLISVPVSLIIVVGHPDFFCKFFAGTSSMNSKLTGEGGEEEDAVKKALSFSLINSDF